MLSFTILDSHPSLEGHFPANPIVPGATIIDYIAKELYQNHKIKIIGISFVRFILPVKPNEKILITYNIKNGLLRFDCTNIKEDILVRGALNI